MRRAVRFAPSFGDAHRALVMARVAAEDRLGALALAQRYVHRFETSAGAWVVLGEASEVAFRPKDALVAFERALMIEERADAAMAAGRLYRRSGDAVTAGARFARAYAAGAGPEALKENAAALRASGDAGAADEAIAMWERETGQPWPG